MAQETSNKDKETALNNKGKDEETDPISSNKGKGKDEETPREGKVPSTIDPTTPSATGSEPGEPEPGVKGVRTEKAGVDGKREEEVIGDGERIPKGSQKKDSPGSEKRVDDTKIPGEGAVSSDNVTPAVTTNETTRSVDAATKGKVDPTDEGDLATPRRATKELPASPAKHLKEKAVPTLGLTVPKSPKNGLAPLSVTTVTDSGLSPLQKALESAEDETLMERVARLDVGKANYQPLKDVVPPAHTDLESDFECMTAPSGPSTPRSRAGRGSFNLMLRSEVPLSDDDDFFLDCDSNASVSNFDGV